MQPSSTLSLLLHSPTSVPPRHAILHAHHIDPELLLHVLHVWIAPRARDRPHVRVHLPPSVRWGCHSSPFVAQPLLLPPSSSPSSLCDGNNSFNDADDDSYHRLRFHDDTSDNFIADVDDAHDDNLGNGDGDAIAFLLCDAELTWTLYPYYRVKRPWKLKDVIGTWLRRLRSRATTPPTAQQWTPTVAISSSALRANRLVPLFTLVTCDKPDLYSRIPSALLARFREPHFSYETNEIDATDDGRCSLAAPPRATSLTFDVNKRIDELVLPEGIVSLSDDDRSSHAPYRNSQTPLRPGTLPESLVVLKFLYGFNLSLVPHSLPSSLRVLRLSHAFNHQLGVGVLPPTLELLSFGTSFDQPLVPHSLPASLLCLQFSSNSSFYYPIGEHVLPAGLRELLFGSQSSFNHPFGVNVLPSSLRRLILSDTNYTQPFDLNVLPTSLHTLALSEYYTCELLPGVLPASLRYLRMSSVYTHPFVRGVLPAHLKLLDVEYVKLGERKILRVPRSLVPVGCVVTNPEFYVDETS